jgi:lipoprotein-releasing system ATP-binding protein
MSEANLFPVLQLTNIHRTFHQAGVDLHILRGINLTVSPGEIVALIGASGAGKSTLLHLTGLLEPPDKGEVVIDGAPSSGLKEIDRTMTRRNLLGFVYQAHHLLPEFSALENIMMPQLIAGRTPDEARLRALELLARLGLADRASHRPAQLSGGEQQRVAIMRALANQPKLLLADEPTGNLDERTANHVVSELMTVVRDQGTAALIATHNKELASRMDRCVMLTEGRLVEIK